VRIPLRPIIASLAVVGAVLTGCAPPPQNAPSLPQTPPMGWNSWNSGIELTEQNIKDTIDAMVSSGMRDAGYRYVNLDAGWAAPQRGPRGELDADPVRFPDGIGALARYAHDRGMLFGLYSSPYNQRCSENPAIGSAGHEAIDAQTFAAWGVDYLKYDWCRRKADHQEQVRVFSAMRDALHATGRRILYSINPNSSDDHTAGARYDWSGIADMTRAATDLVPVWRRVLPPLGPLDGFASGAYLGVPDEFAGAEAVGTPSRPGYWSDADMLVVGLGWDQFVTGHLQGIRRHLTVGDVRPDQLGQIQALTALSDDQLARLLDAQPSLTDTEQRAHFSLWAMLAAPLIAGNDLRSMTGPTRDILTNRDVIAVDQDPRVGPARPLPADPRMLVRPLHDGAVAVAFVNPSESPATITTSATEIALPHASCYRVRDLWAHTDTTTSGAITSGAIPAHAVTLLRITPTCR
jgi:alpha-galactosidase